MTPRPYPAPRDGRLVPPAWQEQLFSKSSVDTNPSNPDGPFSGGHCPPVWSTLDHARRFPQRPWPIRAPSPCPALQTLALPVTLKLSSSPSPRGACWPLLRPHCWAPARKLSKAVVLGKHRAPSWIPCLVGIILLYCLTSRTLNTPRSPMLCYCRRQAPKSSPYPCILAKCVSPHF